MKDNQFLMLDPIETYKSILDGSVNKFPPGFFSANGTTNYLTCKKVIKYLVEEVLKLEKMDIPLKINVKIFQKYKLNGMLKNVFDGSPYKAIDLVYKNEFKPWEFGNTRSNYWDNETLALAVRWLVEEKLHFTADDIVSKLDQELFARNGLGGIFQNFFKGSPYLAINLAYPGKYKPWQFRRTKTNYWNSQTCTIAIKWLVEEKLNLFARDEFELTKEDFKRNGLYGMLIKYFSNNVAVALEHAYPGKYKKEGKNFVLIK